MMKWALVAAGLRDLQRPVEKLSLAQNLALTGTGFIWVRYAMVITPVNYSLAAVNFCVGMTGLSQLARIAAFVLYTPSTHALPHTSPLRRHRRSSAADVKVQ